MLEYGIINERAPHLIADLCELACFLEDRWISRGDVEEIIAQRGGNALHRLLGVDRDDTAEHNERVQALSEEVFRHLFYRKRAFRVWYPFEVEHDVMQLCQDISSLQKRYIRLLLMSRLRMFSRVEIQDMAKEFERICCFAARGLFQGWSTYHFGKGGHDRPRFGARLRDALRVLGEDLAALIIEQHIEEISANDSGDAGIDIVSIHMCGESAMGRASYFFQCAAQQTSWPGKKLEAHPINLERFFLFSCKPGSALMIPVCYRDTNGRWVDSVGFGPLLIDRLRLVRLLDCLFEREPAAVNEIINGFTVQAERGMLNAGEL